MRLLFVLCLFSAPCVFAQSDPLLLLDSKVRKYLAADQNNNTIGGRSLIQLSENEKRVVEASKMLFFRRNFAKRSLQEMMYFRVSRLGLDPNRPEYSTRVLSHSTRLVWSEQRSRFLKIFNADPHRSKTAQAILMRLMNSFEADPDFFIVPENSFWNDQWYIERSTDFILKSPFQVYPLHGIFGEIVDHMAEAMGVSRDDWLENVYAPKLARTIARLNYQYGVSGQFHTQNLLVEVDETSGDLKRIGVRDLQDLVFDAELHERYYPDLNLHELYPRYNLFSTRFAGLHRPDLATLTNLYVVAEDLLWITRDRKLQSRIVNSFLTNCQRTVESIFNLKFTIPDHLSSDPAEYLRKIDTQVRKHWREPLDSRSMLIVPWWVRFLVETSDAVRFNSSDLAQPRVSSVFRDELYAISGRTLWKIGRLSDGRFEREGFSIFTSERDLQKMKNSLMFMKPGPRCERSLRRLGIESRAVPERVETIKVPRF